MIRPTKYELRPLEEPDDRGNSIVRYEQKPSDRDEMFTGDDKSFVGVSRVPAEYEVSICMRLDPASALRLQNFVSMLIP